MPIYAYRCASCGHAQDVLQKLSDPTLTVCPACGAEAYAKQVTAAGFQLKGSGWYVTDFRGGNNAPAPKKEGEAAPAATPAADKSAEKAAADKPASTASDTPAPAAPPPAAAS
ncbi:Type I antifreeze protein [Rubrivivax sp. A210]|uniref:FmdB family zinc ribbon protein n=1 Tax=Rubrivivax sp. A210 TaxID=2772301 RepID=UPI00191AB0C0|nr:zinc ribbon domain-containing protein [Rubrivivax sp. A210]CAD5369128.1 Type I antifreeze protein [Rubrivivax sp. A210]